MYYIYLNTTTRYSSPSESEILTVSAALLLFCLGDFFEVGEDPLVVDLLACSDFLAVVDSFFFFCASRKPEREEIQRKVY